MAQEVKKQTDSLQSTEIEEWFLSFIDFFREKFKSLKPKEKKASERTLTDFSEPCQILIVSAKDPSFQILICSHNADLADKIIKIFGPYENKNLIDSIEKDFLTDNLVNKIGKDALEGFLVGTLRNIKRYNPYVRGPIKSHIGSKMRISGPLGRMTTTFGWQILGSITEFESEVIANECIEQIISTAKPPSSTTVQPPEDRPILDGFGTYIYPPIWIGEPPKFSFKQKVAGSTPWMGFSEKSLEVRYKEHPLMLTTNGYIAIGEKEKTKAIESLNEIMATMLILEIPTYIIRESDVGKCCFRERSSNVAWPEGGIRYGLYGPDQQVRRQFMKQRTVDEKKLTTMITWAETFTSDNKLKTLLLLFLEAYTHFMNSEYKQALVMGWVILEDIYVKDLWAQVVQKRTGEDKHRVGKLGSWTVDAKLESLNISQTLTDDEYSRLMEIKDARNDVVHEGKEPAKEITEKCVNLTLEVVQNYIGNYLKGSLKSLV